VLDDPELDSLDETRLKELKVMDVEILVRILVGMLVGLVKAIDPVELEIEPTDEVTTDDVLVDVVDTVDIVVADDVVPDELADKTVLDVEDTCNEGEADVLDGVDARTLEEVLVIAPIDVDIVEDITTGD
jgi:hypothetical protein